MQNCYDDLHITPSPFPQVYFHAVKMKETYPKVKLMGVYSYNNLKDSGKHIITQRNCILPAHRVLHDSQNKHRLFPKAYELV